jgi:hypothetical protein
VTPHVLTEVSNLGDLQGRERMGFRGWFVNTVEQATEYFDNSRQLVRDERLLFDQLGIADSAIAALGCHQCLLIDDLLLWIALVKRGSDAINFSHLRPLNEPS